MTLVTCPYCNKAMRIITNLRAHSARSYFICDECGSRSPRAKQEIIEDIKGFPTRNEIPKTIALVEGMARDLATKPFDIENFDLSRTDLSEVLRTD